jgi:ATP-dependent Clp endopeptidase proteolytic subunit ClpP
MKDFRDRLKAFAVERSPIKAEAPAVDADGRVAVIRLYDPIDSWGQDYGVSAKEFVSTLDTLPERVEEIRLHINSPGGDVFDGIAILNALRSHGARVVAVVDGIAASAASFVACGADELVMARNSELMIHDAWGLCVGNAADMAAMAEMLGHLSDNIASIYAEKAGGEVAEWRAAMAAETWYSAEEAVAAGLADRVDTVSADADAKNRFDLSVFAYAGRDAAPTPEAHPASTANEDPDPGQPAAASAASPAAVAPAVTDPADGTEDDGAGDLELRARSLQLQVDAVA